MPGGVESWRPARPPTLTENVNDSRWNAILAKHRWTSTMSASAAGGAAHVPATYTRARSPASHATVVEPEVSHASALARPDGVLSVGGEARYGARCAADRDPIPVLLPRVHPGHDAAYHRRLQPYPSGHSRS